MSSYWIICSLLTKKKPKWFIPPTVFTGHGWLTHNFPPSQNILVATLRSLSSTLTYKRYLRHLSHATSTTLILPRQLTLFCHSCLSSCARQSIYSDSKRCVWTSRPSSHCSINTDILRMTVPVIKACQSGNYLLLSGLPVVTLLKPIPPYFICSLCEFLSVEPR